MIAQQQLSAEPATRERILRTAFQLFHEQGFHATGVATIGREAGINPGSLYHFFASKDQLLLQVLEFALTYLAPAVMEPVERKTEDPIERVFALLKQYRDGMVQHGCRLGCPIGNLALEVSDGDLEARRLIHRNFENWAARVEGWLLQAGDRLPADLNRANLARFILTVMEGGLMQARAADSLAAFDASVAVLREHLDLLMARATAEQIGNRRTRRGHRGAIGKSSRRRG